MFSRKSSIIATIFIAFMYLVPVSVFAAGNGTIVVIAQDTSKKQIAAPIYVDNELMGTGKVTLTLPAKKHKVKFGDMEGYAIVSPRSGKKKVLVKAGKTTTVKGTYQASTGTYTASGTYTWNSTKGKLTVNWTTTDFVCEGPELGTETKTGVTITATTMTWPEDGNDNNDMTWSRSSGTSGDIVGTWTASDSTTGNSWTVTFNADGTVSGVGNIVKCGDDGGGGENPKAEAQNWSSGYIVQLRYSDEKETATSVSVTGHGINGSVTLTYNKGMGSWGSGTSRESNLLWYYIPYRAALYLHIFYNRYNRHMDGHFNGVLLPGAVCLKHFPNRDGFRNPNIQLDRD